MPHDALRLGRIDYLNVLPLFHHLERRLAGREDIVSLRGHPAELNRLLAEGRLDVAPASAFEYLRAAESYRLLPDAAISAPGAVQSVLLLSPFDREETFAWASRPGAEVGLTTASASSAALLKVLWRLAWRLPEPTWREIEPGSGLAGKRPFLEIGDLALRRRVDPPRDWTIIDLGLEWRRWSGLPFVFAVWFVRRGLGPTRRAALREIQAELAAARRELPAILEDLADSAERPDWLPRAAFLEYFQAVRYDFGPAEQTGLLLFADACRRLGLLAGAPALVWQPN